MEVVNKNRIIIQSDWSVCDCNYFLKKILPTFTEIRVGVEGGQEPFAHIFFKVNKKEVIDIVKMNKMTVTFSIMFNSRVKENLKDILYIKKLTQNII